MKEYFLLIFIIASLVLFIKNIILNKHLVQKARQSEELERNLRTEQERLEREIAALARFKDVVDADAAAQKIRLAAMELQANTKKAVAELQQEAQAKADLILVEAHQEVEKMLTEANHNVQITQDRINMRLGDAKNQAQQILKNAAAEAKSKKERSEALLSSANQQADQIIQEAKAQAEKIAGDAYLALTKADELEHTVIAMKNVIEGYGDRYLKPTYSLLDELAESYAFDEAGQQLKLARERSKLMTEHNRAAICDYVEPKRKETAIRFVLDAFNGKVDSILSRAKVENFGTLEQQIRDAYALVNNNGSAFRSARIRPEYLEARITELRWLIAVNALREQEKEEQRRIREQIREEEKARREIERALKDAAKEEETIQKAMEKARLQVEKATEEQKTIFEAKLAELEQKLAEAEERNQRALSMAQQTKAGHVYIISNIGSFGENVFKVGMTRRLEPLDRVRELGDASVPFGFDVHAMIWCEDAPALETTLHKHFVAAQVNKVNPRKEFFRLPLNELRQVIESQSVEASWTMLAKATEYRESLAIEEALRDQSVVADNWLRHQQMLDSITIEPELVEV